MLIGIIPIIGPWLVWIPIDIYLFSIGRTGAGLGLFIYRIFRRFLSSYLSTKYSIAAQTAVLVLEDISLNPSILNFLGIILFVFGLSFVFFALRSVNKHISEKESFFSVIFYLLVYIVLRPIVLIVSLYKFFTGKYSCR